MNVGKMLCVRGREDWREWLEANSNTEKEIWLIYSAKNSGKPLIQYNDAVKEALSFGWIDSAVRRFDKHSSDQRFSPINPDSKYSQANKERLNWLVKEGRLHPSLREPVEKIISTEFVFPPDILQAIKGTGRHGKTIKILACLSENTHCLY